MPLPFVIDDAYLPTTLNCQPMTDEEFMAFCQEHPDLNRLINPDDGSVTIHRAGGETETRRGIDFLAGEGPVATFTLDLAFIWKPI